ncbi:iron chaperone [Cohnella boryungensis]|uniref:Iron chaperone n=1 Tax=Cohnella boryungensis TaxID=768479 RepID=A0ABV8SHA0_9BACL
MDNRIAYASTEAYIAQFPPHVQEILNTLRQVIREAAPEATEKISYQMPTFFLHQNLVHFAGYKSHIGFYPGASGIAAFQPELAAYKGAKGSVQFPLDKPLPYELIARIVRYRVAQNIETAAAKAKKKK